MVVKEEEVLGAWVLAMKERIGTLAQACENLAVPQDLFVALRQAMITPYFHFRNDYLQTKDRASPYGHEALPEKTAIVNTVTNPGAGHSQETKNPRSFRVTVHGDNTKTYKEWLKDRFKARWDAENLWWWFYVDQSKLPIVEKDLQERKLGYEVFPA